MGFNLKTFIEELEAIIANQELTAEEKLHNLSSCIAGNEEYARECGML